MVNPNKEAEDALFEEFKAWQQKNGWSTEEMAERFNEETEIRGWNVRYIRRNSGYIPGGTALISAMLDAKKPRARAMSDTKGDSNVKGNTSDKEEVDKNGESSNRLESSPKRAPMKKESSQTGESSKKRKPRGEGSADSKRPKSG